MNKINTQTKEVWSANGWYLFCGIISCLMLVLTEGCIVREFFIKPFEEAIIMALVMQLPCLLLLAMTTSIKDWIRRKKFNLYYCKLETGTDIDYIKENYSVKDISPRGILFVEKEDSLNFQTWNLYQGYKYMYEIEERFFKQP